MEELKRRLDKVERDMDKIRNEQAGTMGELTRINKAQTKQIGEVHDAILGTIDGKNPGLVNLVGKLTEWKGSVVKASWMVVAPICAALGVGLLLVVAFVLWKGMH